MTAIRGAPKRTYDAQSVTVTRSGDLAIIAIDNPPVNALSFHVREPLMKALETLRDDRAVKGIVLTCKGRTFVAEPT